MISPRLLASAAIVACWAAGPAAAQPTDYEAIVRVMRQCAAVADIPARVACYDAAVRLDPAISEPESRQLQPQSQPPLQPQALPQPRAQPPSPAAPVEATPPSSAAGFGGERLRSRDENRQEQSTTFSSAVTSAAEREPGIYLLTLADGSQWQLVEPAPRSYAPPRPGATIVLSRGALGGFFLEYDDQVPLRVRRVR